MNFSHGLPRKQDLLTCSCKGGVVTSSGAMVLALLQSHMIKTHWLPPTCIYFSMTLNVFASMTAVRHSQTVDMLNGASELRSWLSRGRSDLDQIERTEQEEATNETEATGDGSEHGDSTSFTAREESAGVRALEQAPLESAIAAIKSSMSLPRYLLNAALLVLVIGIGLWGLFLWAGYRGSPHRDDVIAVVIVLSFVAIYAVVHWFNRDLFKSIDVKERDQVSQTDTTGSYGDGRGWVKVDKLPKEVGDAREGICGQ
jgi:hypothetical protein